MRVRAVESGWFVVLDRGDDLHASLVQVARGSDASIWNPATRGPVCVGAIFRPERLIYIGDCRDVGIERAPRPSSPRRAGTKGNEALQVTPAPDGWASPSHEMNR